jgi:methyltransferase
VFTLAFLALVFIPMLLEARRATSNESAQRKRGGIEAPHDVYGIMRVAYPAAFLAMLVEHAVRGPASPKWLLAGLALFAAAKGLKWWAILTLGHFWTFRVIIVPAASLVASGPYRFVRHPNYIGVIGELIGIALATGAWVTGPLAVLGFGLLILKRIEVEERALEEYNEP